MYHKKSNIQHGNHILLLIRSFPIWKRFPNFFQPFKAHYILKKKQFSFPMDSNILGQTQWHVLIFSKIWQSYNSQFRTSIFVTKKHQYVKVLNLENLLNQVIFIKSSSIKIDFTNISNKRITMPKRLISKDT